MQFTSCWFLLSLSLFFFWLQTLIQTCPLPVSTAWSNRQKLYPGKTKPRWKCVKIVTDNGDWMKRLLNNVLWRQIGLVNIKHQDTGQKAIYSLCGLVGKILQIYHSTKSLLSGHFKAKGRLCLSYPNTLQFFRKPRPSLGESCCKAGDFPQHRCALLTPVSYK